MLGTYVSRSVIPCYLQSYWAFLVGYFLVGLVCLLDFFLSTVFLFHGTFTINSLAHVWGSRRYQTKDTSRNNWFLALLTLGEGWHNNHHHYMRSARQGFFWWEVDPTYYALVVLSWMQIVWDLREVPDDKSRPLHRLTPSKT